MRVVMVYGGKEEARQTNRLLRLLYLVFKADQPSGVKLAELKKDFDISLTEHEGKELDEMCNLSAGIAERNYEHGWAVGNKEGEQKGRAEGRREERISMLLAMMNSFHISAQQAMEAANIPKSEWAGLEPYLK